MNPDYEGVFGFVFFFTAICALLIAAFVFG
jgi:hypothetical protein